MLIFPEIEPVIFQIGPFALRWYSLAYLLGVGGAIYVLRRNFAEKMGLNTDALIDFATAILLGVLIGGRLGYVLFYDAAFYLQNPLKVFAIWEGGMAYHGGAIGAALAVLHFARRRKLNKWMILDRLAAGSTIGIGLGRLANFINAELVGRVTDLPWGMVFPNAGELPRHPSQLYEAIWEGLILGSLLFYLLYKRPPKPGILFSIYLIGYGVGRFIIEFFRNPDVQLGVNMLGLSRGQELCIVMVVMGAAIAIKQRQG